MDEFLKDIHVLVFKEWVYHQESNKYHVYLNKDDQNIIHIESEYGLGEMTFNPMNIIELKVTNKITNEVDFYLHFQMKTMKHAVGLFNEMIESITSLSHKPITKVLLSCSGGLTTSYFANKLNEVVKLLGFDMEISAVGYNQLFQVGNQYDVIFLAPQISYLHAKVQNILKDQTVLKIPPQIFAKYDVGKMLSLITDISKNKKTFEKMKSTPLSLKMDVNNQNKILCLSIFKNKERVHIAYRLYNKNNIILDNEIIKYNIVLQDMYDVLDTVLLQYPNISIIGMSIPGIINNGFLSSSYIDDVENNEIEKAFTTRYTQKILITNDVNAAAVGFYVTQKEYHSLMFLFQPVSLYAGAGIIINGQLISGHNNFAGEVKFLPTELSDNQLNLSKVPEGTLELVSKTMISAMCIIDPQIVVIFSDLITDVSELEKEIKKSIPSHYIPHILKVDNMLEYILLGQMTLCAQSE